MKTLGNLFGFAFLVFCLWGLGNSLGGAKPAHADETKPAVQAATPEPSEIAERVWLRAWEPTAKVFEVQACLSVNGYDLGPSGIDGKEGPKTVAAVTAYNAKGVATDDECRRCYAGIQAVRTQVAEIEKAFKARDAQTASQARYREEEAGKNIRTHEPGVETGTAYQYAPAPAYVADGWAKTCPNGSCYGAIGSTGNARTTYVREYTRRDGTHVGAHYRSHR